MSKQSPAHTCMQVSKAMHFMHNRGMVHADLKLGNLLLEYHNNNPNTLRCVVADFGQSRPLARKAGRGDGSIVVSPHVIAPEVIRNPEAPRTPAGDVYSFAIVLLEIFAGVRPCTGSQQTHTFIHVCGSWCSWSNQTYIMQCRVQTSYTFMHIVSYMHANTHHFHRFPGFARSM